MAAAYALGVLAIRKGRRELNAFTTRPVLTLAAVCSATFWGTPALKTLYNNMGVGMLIAERNHRAAMKKMECSDCIDDLRSFTYSEIEAIKNRDYAAEAPAANPELREKMRKKGAEHIELLRREIKAMDNIIQLNPSARCQVHQGLRNSPEDYTHDYLPIFAIDRLLAHERVNNNL